MARPDPQDLWYQAFGGGQNALQNTQSLQSGFSGINNVGDVQSRFGVSSDTSGIYNPLRRQLAAQRGSAEARVGARAGSSATPEGSLFAPIEQGYQGGLNTLASQEGQSNISQGNFAANLLQGALGSQDQFGLQKNQLAGNLASGLMGSDVNYQNAQYQNRDPQFMSYLMQLLGMGSNVASSALKPAAVAAA